MSRQAVPPQANPLRSSERTASAQPEILGSSTGKVASRTRYRLFSKVIVPWLFILPILLIHLFVVAIPALSGVYYSLTEWSGIGEATFIGLENFRRLIFEDEGFKRALGNNIVWMIFFLTVPFALALLASSLLARIRRGGMIYRTALFIPYLLPSVVTAMIWRNLMNPRLGVGAQLASLGVPGLDVALLGRSDTALLAIAFIDNWHYWGFLMGPVSDRHAVDPDGALRRGKNRRRESLAGVSLCNLTGNSSSSVVHADDDRNLVVPRV